MPSALDDIDWAALTHAHGPADDVPSLLEALRAAEEDSRLAACATLHETLWHQGTVYPASAAAVPFLLALVRDPDAPDRRCAVSLLCCLATGTGWRSAAGKAPCAEEARVLTELHDSITSGLPDLLPSIHEVEGLGTLVAATLAAFPEHRDWLLPAIDEALARAVDEAVRQELGASRERLLAP